jgi:hypothetical protein
VLITQQIILGNDKYQLKVKLYLDQLIKEHLKKGKPVIRIKFNQPGMVHEVQTVLVSFRLSSKRKKASGLSERWTLSLSSTSIRMLFSISKKFI